jgi:glyceraldehyde-3-phosphate dehydrogenase (NAD(P))
VSDARVRTAVALDIPVYGDTAERAADMVADGLPVAGSLDDLMDDVEVVVDCTPAGIGARNLERYRARGIRAILQGGEKHEVTGHSFVASANYATAAGRDATRVVSCNTTATVRTLSALRRANLLQKARGVLVRRATDPWESDQGGIMNTVVPESRIPSHQGPDARTVVPELDVVTIAAKAAHTQNHCHFWVITLARDADRDEVLGALHGDRRIAFVRSVDGLGAPNRTIELMKDLGRPRGDMYEVAVWSDILAVAASEAFLTYQVDNQAIVIPENVDAIRALLGVVSDAEESMRRTDDALGIRQDFLG